MVVGAGDVGYVNLAEQRQQRLYQPADRPHLSSIWGRPGWLGKICPEQFVGPVNQMNFQARSSSR